MAFLLQMLLYVHRDLKDYLRRGAQDDHLDFHTPPELWTWKKNEYVHGQGKFENIRTGFLNGHGLVHLFCDPNRGYTTPLMSMSHHKISRTSLPRPGSNTAQQSACSTAKPTCQPYTAGASEVTDSEKMYCILRS